jgi:hypothetical protein
MRFFDLQFTPPAPLCIFCGYPICGRPLREHVLNDHSDEVETVRTNLRKGLVRFPKGFLKIDNR